MYDYCFYFYKPGKQSYSQKEIITTVLALQQVIGYEVKFPPRDPHADQKKGVITFQPQETELNLKLTKSDKSLGFYLNPAEGRYGKIAGLYMNEEQFEENPRENTGLFYRTALAISKALEPYFAWGDHELELDKLSHGLRFDRVGALAWANFFSREFLEKIGGLEKVLLDPENEETRKETAETLEFYSVAPLELAPNPTEATHPAIILGIEGRYPNTLFRSFEMVSDNMIELEP